MQQEWEGKSDGPRSFVIGIYSILVISFVGFSSLVWFAFNPYDRVEISVLGMPKGTQFLSIVVEAKEGTEVMNWYSGMFATTPMHPAVCNYPIRQHDDHPLVDHAFVQWKPGSRYGVLHQHMDRTWWITWFDAASLPIHERSWWRGGGSVRFDLAQGNAEALPLDCVDSLGIKGIPSAAELPETLPER